MIYKPLSFSWFLTHIQFRIWIHISIHAHGHQSLG